MVRKHILSWFNRFGIQTKVIILHLSIIVIPFMVIAFIVLNDTVSLKNSLYPGTQLIFMESKEMIGEVVNHTVEGSIKFLDQQAQENIERLSREKGMDIAQFLYQRNDDLMFLASRPPKEALFRSFIREKSSLVIIPPPYIYSEDSFQWMPQYSVEVNPDTMRARLIQNDKNFRHIPFSPINTQKLPVYKEISFFNIEGIERIKVSSIDNKLRNISLQENTYIGSETYFDSLQTLLKGDIYVSDVVGAYVGSYIRGVYNRSNVSEAGINFNPYESAYAGVENPVGKRFKGIVRFVTPCFKEGIKVGYLSLALDYRHIQEFTDYLSPIAIDKRAIPDATTGNYSFIFDYRGLCIAHPKNFYISGFDPKTGKRVAPWMDQELFQTWKDSGISDGYTFLEGVTPWDRPDLFKFYSSDQMLDSGQLALDTRYGREAMNTLYGLYQITSDGGSGSYQYFWDGVWKVVGASPIPYFTGQYSKSPRGFGIVCIGANVSNFHAPVVQLRKSMDSMLTAAYFRMEASLEQSKSNFSQSLRDILSGFIIGLVIIILIVVFVVLWLSKLLKKKLNVLITGARELTQGNVKYRIPVLSNDEIGKLANSFNLMASKIEENLKDQSDFRKRLIFQNIRLERIGSLLRSIRDNSPDAILVYHTNGSLFSMNKTGEDMLEYSLAELKSLSIGDYSGNGYTQELALDKLKKVIKDDSLKCEWVLKKKSLMEFPVMIRFRKVRLREEDLILAFVTDITKHKKAKEKLKESHRRLLNIIEFLPDATFVINEDKRVIAWNRAMEEMTNVPKKEIIGKGDYAYSIPLYGERRPALVDLIEKDEAGILSSYDNVIDKGSILIAEVFLPAINRGKGGYVRITASRLIAKNGRSYGAIESVRDITHLKQAQDELRNSEKRCRNIIEQSVLGIFQTSLEGKCINANMALARMLGYDSPQTAINSINDIASQLYCNPRRRSEIIDQLLNDDKAKTFEETFKDRNGNLWTGNVKLRLVRDSEGNPLYLEGFVEDITEQKNKESKLKEYCEYLKKLVDLHTNELTEKMAELESLKNSRSAYVDNIEQKVSDGILSVSYYITELIMNLSEYQMQQLIRFSDNSNNLQKLIVKILELSIIEAGIIDVYSELFNLQELVTQEINNIMPLAESKGLKIKIVTDNSLPVEIKIDLKRLKQILNILLNNAIKCSREGTVTVILKQEKSCIMIVIKDTGSGIQMVNSDFVFEPFSQIDKEDIPVEEQTGLDLAICKGLVKLLGGNIQFESRWGEGSIFYVWLPLKRV